MFWCYHYIKWIQLCCGMNFSALNCITLYQKRNIVRVGGFFNKRRKKENYLTLVRANLLELVTPRKIYSSSNLVRIAIWFWTTVSLILCSICYQHCCCWRRKFSSLFWHPEDIGTAFGGYHYEENILKR